MAWAIEIAKHSISAIGPPRRDLRQVVSIQSGTIHKTFAQIQGYELNLRHSQEKRITFPSFLNKLQIKTCF
jgi:hypothetical protein